MTKKQRSIWRKNNPEKHREEQRLHYARHRGAVKERTKRLKALHPERNRMYHATRSTAKTRAGGTTTSAQWLRICRAVKFRCLCCGKRKKLECDHVIPISKGGSSFPHNLQPLCKRCNNDKHTKSTDFRFLPRWRSIFTRMFTRKWFRF